MSIATSLGRAELAELVRDHQVGVWRYLRFLGCADDEAEDLAQETFLTMIRRPPELRSRSETAAWLRKVARTRLLLARRQAGREPSMTALDAAETAWAEAAGDSGLDDYLAALAGCLETAIDERKRRAIELRYRDNQTREQIAAALDLSPDGVKTILRRARAALRECIERKTRQS